MTSACEYTKWQTIAVPPSSSQPSAGSSKSGTSSTVSSGETVIVPSNEMSTPPVEAPAKAPTETLTEMPTEEPKGEVTQNPVIEGDASDDSTKAPSAGPNLHSSIENVSSSPSLAGAIAGAVLQEDRLSLKGLPIQAVMPDLHVFARATTTDSEGKHVLVHLVKTAAGYKQDSHAAPAWISDNLDMDESPAVAQTKTGFHVVSRSGDKLIYWQCAEDLQSASEKAFSCKAKFLTATGPAKIWGCAVVTSDPFGRVHIFAKSAQSHLLIYFSGTSWTDMKFVSSVSGWSEPLSCPAAAYNPADKKIYVVSSGGDGKMLVVSSDPIESDAALSLYNFHASEMAVPYKFNGGMSSCGENGRVTTAYDSASESLHVLYHEYGGKNAVVVTSGFESLPNTLKQKRFGTGYPSVDIDDYPTGVFDNDGDLHVFADKANDNSLLEGVMNGDMLESWYFNKNIEVERAPAVAYEPSSNMLHVFMKQRGNGNQLVHYSKTLEEGGDKVSSWKNEVLGDYQTHFEGCPATIMEN